MSVAELVQESSWLELCGVPRRELRAFRRIELDPSLAAWVKPAESTATAPWSLTLLGPTGCGKTWTAIEVLARSRSLLSAETLRLYRPAVFVDAVELMDDFRSNLDAEPKLLAKLVAVPLLVLDDVGAERVTEYARDRIGALLRKRYNREARTVLTSNAPSLRALAEGLDPRIVSRLSAGLVAVLGGADRRPGSGRS